MSERMDDPHVNGTVCALCRQAFTSDDLTKSVPESKAKVHKACEAEALDRWLYCLVRGWQWPWAIDTCDPAVAAEQRDTQAMLGPHAAMRWR